jgi:hypothetical protein
VIHTAVALSGKRWEIDVTLTPRWGMSFRMLLGRQAVRRHFLVDPGRSFCGGRLHSERPLLKKPKKTKKKVRRGRKVRRRRPTS